METKHSNLKGQKTHFPRKLAWKIVLAVCIFMVLLSLIVYQLIKLSMSKTVSTHFTGIMLMLLVAIGLAVVFLACINIIQRQTNPLVAIESELDIARRIQMSIIPKIYPQRKDIDIYGYMQPAKDVGGDLFDFFIRDERLFFSIGDVSGKGVSAALPMATMCTAFRLLAESEPRLERIVGRINDSMTCDKDSDFFVTLFVGVLDLTTGKLTYCNAGHKCPYIDGKPLPIKRNLPVGAMPAWQFTAQETVLESGSMLFAYTDGLSEAENAENQFFGEERMKRLLQMTPGEPQSLIERMLQAVHDFAGDTAQSDDLAMLAIRYNGASSNKPSWSITLPCDTSQTDRLAEWMEQVDKKAGLDDKSAMKLTVAVEEAVVNVISYAYPSGTEGYVKIDAVVDNEKITLTISDEGLPFDPTTVVPADTNLDANERPIGGLGIHMIRLYTDSMTYERLDNRNVLTLTKRIQHNNKKA